MKWLKEPKLFETGVRLAGFYDGAAPNNPSSCPISPAPCLLTALCILLLSLSGCIKKTNWVFDSDPPVRLVVEGILTDEWKVQQVKLSEPVAALNDPATPVTGAIVLVSNEDSAWILKEDSLVPGRYHTAGLFRAEVGKTYTLQIFHGGNIYSARAAMEPGRLFNELTYIKNESNDLFHIEWVAEAFSATYPAMWEILIDWSAVPGYEMVPADSCHARLLFYTLPTLDVSEIFAPAVEIVSFPAGSLITERRYSLSAGHASFIRELLLETTWQGSLFPTANANVSTNLSTGGAGYFGVCGVTSLSLIVIE